MRLITFNHINYVGQVIKIEKSGFQVMQSSARRIGDCLYIYLVSVQLINQQKVFLINI